MEIEVINGVKYYNVFGLYDRVMEEEEIATLPPEHQGLERLTQNIAQQELANEKSREESK